MTKEKRTKQLLTRTFVVGCVVGTLITYGVSHIELPKPKQKCELELCDCYDSFGRPLDTVTHCTVHGHACMEME